MAWYVLYDVATGKCLSESEDQAMVMPISGQAVREYPAKLNTGLYVWDETVRDFVPTRIEPVPVDVFALIAGDAVLNLAAAKRDRLLNLLLTNLTQHERYR